MNTNSRNNVPPFFPLRSSKTQHGPFLHSTKLSDHITTAKTTGIDSGAQKVILKHSRQQTIFFLFVFW